MYIFTFQSMLPGCKILNFPKFDFRVRKKGKDNWEIFDVIRKKFVILTPEEWVRQHTIHFLVVFKKIPASFIGIEKHLILNNTKRRTDIVVYDSNLRPLLIVECKAPEIEITQSVVDQIQRYNLSLNVPALFITNGCNHVFFRLTDSRVEVLVNFPEFEQLINF
jgi:type I site-specific restriction endonuclease